MKKIKPLKEYSTEASKKVYKHIYADVERFMQMKMKLRDISTLVYYNIKDELKGRSILDIGCGYGRFCLMAAQSAERVVGVDMTAQAIEVAKILQKALNDDKVEFILSEANDINLKEVFDYIYLGGILEHIIDPDSIMKTIDRLLCKGGKLLMDCPAEFNFRGIISTAFWKLFNFPMTLTDVRVVTLSFIEELAKKHEYELIKVSGYGYSRGWSEMAYKDLEHRMSQVLKDVNDKIQMVDVDKKSFDSWVLEITNHYSKLLDDWKQREILKPIPVREEVIFNEDVLRDNNMPVKVVKEFFGQDIMTEPYYSDVYPYNTIGSVGIYILRKK
jgi:ubiquinone/menaquinone biosynthesis C-methylase UbiE|tara:strand:+ start:303 stop:1292 length:990 start_codon:yes stop_codon:yes gene_type:complete